MSKSMVTQDKSFSTTGSPLSSLLAGERVQFGAVTTPSFLPSVTQAISNGIGPLPSPTCKTESSEEHTSASENAHAIFFEKAKYCDESCIHLEYLEVEAEAAASVAAISSDEVVGNGLGTTYVSVSNNGKFGGVDECGLTSQGNSYSKVAKAATSRGFTSSRSRALGGLCRDQERTTPCRHRC